MLPSDFSKLLSVKNWNIYDCVLIIETQYSEHNILNISNAFWWGLLTMTFTYLITYQYT